MKLYFAGVEAHPDILAEERVPHVLASPLGTGFGNRLRDLLLFCRKNFKSIFCDSGAFSFRIQHMKGQQVYGLQEYVDRYSEFLTKYRGLADLWAEVDVPMIVGDGQVRRWREQLERSGAQVIPVFHWTCHSPSYLRDLAASYPYVAIGSLVGTNIRSGKLTTFVETVHSQGAKVHLFGVSDTSVLLSLPRLPDSVDSTTYIAAKKYALGKRVLLDTKTWRIHPHVQNPTLVKQVSKSHNPEVGYELLRESIRRWLLFEQKCEEIHRQRWKDQTDLFKFSSEVPPMVKPSHPIIYRRGQLALSGELTAVDHGK